MKTRGAGSLLNPKVLYRAFLVPLVMRLVGISDTLSLSVETRGFTLGKVKYSVYKREVVALSDIIFLLAIIAGGVLVVVL
jgi:energy-coupling factor transporter transmembrane protein EcfT